MTVKSISGIVIRNNNLYTTLDWDVTMSLNFELTMLKPQVEGFPVGSRLYVPLLF